MQPLPSESAMDISFDEDGDSPILPSGGPYSLGYYGWAATRLLLVFHRVFLKNQGNDRGDLLAESIKLRGMIFWCLSSINVETFDSIESEAAFENESVFNDRLTDFYHVWTLADGLFLDSPPLPAVPLLKWLKSYMQSGGEDAAYSDLNEAERMAREADDQGGFAELTPAYWNAVRTFVVGVLPRRAEKMLRSHPDGRDHTSEVGALARQLSKMPLLVPEELNGGSEGVLASQYDRQAFSEDWIRWQKRCKAAAASFGVVPGVGGERVGDGDERRHLRWIWGALCGVRSCLEEAVSSWVQLFAAVLAFERPDVKHEEVGPLLRDCARKCSPAPDEEFLIKVIRDASAGAVSSIKSFARDRGDTVALSACAAHLIDQLFRAQLPSVTSLSRSWYLQRLADGLKAFPGGGWELAASYLYEIDGGDVKRLTELAHAVVPGSERAAHELVEWCRVKRLGEDAVAVVCRARGAAWLRKTGFHPSAWEAASHGEQELNDGDSDTKYSRFPGASGKAAYWLAKGGGGILLERLCAEVSERLMVEVSPGPRADAEAQKAVVAEAEGVLAAVLEGDKGTEFSFLERYKEIADHLLAETEAQARNLDGLAGVNARLAGFCAVDMLAPRGPSSNASVLPGYSLHPPLPSRTWAHLLRIALPVLEASPREGAGEFQLAGHREHSIDSSQVHVLLSKMQSLSMSTHRVGTECGDRATSTLSAAPAPYGFGSGKGEELRIRVALANCLARTMMTKNREETALEACGGTRGWKISGSGRLQAEALIAPRVAVDM